MGSTDIRKLIVNACGEEPSHAVSLTWEPDGTVRVMEWPDDGVEADPVEHLEQVAALLGAHGDLSGTGDFADEAAKIIERIEALQARIRGAVAAGW